MSQYKQWDIQVFDERRHTYVNDSTGVGVVMNAGLSTLVTLVADQQGTALSQPVALNAGRLTFYTAKSVTSVDVSILTAQGQAIYARSLSSSVHRLDLDPEDRDQLLVIPFKATNAVQVVTGFKLPADCLIDDTYIRVLVVDSAKTLDVGFVNAVEGGDENGLLAATLLTNLGFVEPAPSISNGSNIDFTGATTYGALLGSAITGSDAVATNGGFQKHKYKTDGTIKSLVYTPSSGASTCAGLIYISYQSLSSGS